MSGMTGEWMEWMLEHSYHGKNVWERGFYDFW